MLHKLQEKGFRLTKPRQEILSTIQKHPLTVEEIAVLLKQNHIHVDLASIYRSLELFTQLHFIQEVDFGDGKKRFELCSTDHHHHVVCKKCGKVKDVEIAETKILEQIQKQSGFHIESHQLEFFGLCPHCQ